MSHIDHQQILEKDLAQVTAELQTIATQDETTGDWVAVPEGHQAEADPNSEADVVEDWNERRALMAQLETRYHNITLALTKFDLGTFGKCEICEEEVEDKRLAVNPSARTCKLHLERERELPL